MTLENQKDDWSVCQPGTLTMLSRQMRRQASRRRITKLALGVTSVLAGCSAAILLLFNPMASFGPKQQPEVFSPNHDRVSISAHLSCPDVLGSCDEYLLGSLDGQSRHQIRSHLRHCTACDKAYRARAQELQVEYTARLLPPAELLPPVEKSFALFVAR